MAITINKNWMMEIQFADDMAAASLDKFPGTSTYTTVGVIDGINFEGMTNGQVAGKIFHMLQNDFAPNNSWVTDPRVEHAVMQSPGYDDVPGGTRSMSEGDRIVFRNVSTLSERIQETLSCYTVQVADVGFKIVNKVTHGGTVLEPTS